MEWNFLTGMKYRFFSSIGSLCDPGFGQIVTFSFYDGAELGLAVFPSGETLRFAVIGESRSRMFRAFECSLLEGNWCAKILDACGENIDPGARELWPEMEAVLQLEKDVLDARVLGHYVAVGNPALDMLSAVEVSGDESKYLQSLLGSEAFSFVHAKIKSNRKKLGHGTEPGSAI